MTTALICVRGYRIGDVLDSARTLLAPDLRWVIAHVIDQRAADEVIRALDGLAAHGPGHRHVEDRLRKTIDEQTQAIEAEIAAWLTARQHDAEIVIVHGRPDVEILRLVEEHQVTVIALGSTPGQGGPIQISPPVRFIVDHAPCAVLILRLST
jgi:nucleotide-binding universal stress UspA family protein